MNQWWNLDINETAEALASDLSNGLSSLEAANRLEKYGLDKLAKKR
jgi:magnesium-transporting ATPase (P-type)